jgi:DNA-binding response OmpR family regulator
MVAEDNAAIGMTLAVDLKDAGYAVAGPFSHSAAALAWLQDFSPDVAALDVLLEDGSCVPLVREPLRSLPRILRAQCCAGPARVAGRALDCEAVELC